MDRLTELLELLANEEARSRLSDDELGAINGELTELFRAVRAGEVEGVDRHDTEVLRQIGDCIVATCAESAMRFAAAAAAADEIAAIERDAGLAEASGDTESEGDPEGDPEGEGETTDPAEGDPEGTEGTDPAEGDGSEREAASGQPEGEPVVAGAAGPPALPSIAELNRRRPAARREAPAARVVSEPGQIRWLPTGEFVSFDEYIQRVASYDGPMRTGEKVRLGRQPTVRENAIHINSRQDSPEEISRKLEQAVAGLLDPRSWGAGGVPQEPILAAGGWGTPTPVVYDVDTLAVADRPVRAALPSVTVDRGGLTWVVQPKFSDIVTGGPTTTTAAVGIWTAAIDETPGSRVKSKMRAPTPTTRTVQLDALYASISVGLLQSRAFPEWIRAWQQNVDAAWARMAETYLLDKIEASTLTKQVSQGTVIGAARDYVSFLIILAAGERNRQRMRPNATLRLLYPAWLEDLVGVDLFRDGSGAAASPPQLVGREWIQSTLRAVNINGAGYLDSSTSGGQLLEAQADDDDLNELPQHTRSYLFPEGTFVVGDGGEFDAGVIRDEDLVETNDFRLFRESFEALFDRGHWAYQLDAFLCPSGTASAPVDIQHLCTTGS
jgi:hypothetical protein